MIVLAIDPGPVQSAWMLYDAELGEPAAPSRHAWRDDVFGKHDNADVLEMVATKGRYHTGDLHLAVEMIASYGMPVGAEVFETCVYIGRLIQAWNRPHTLVYRREVKLHLCGQARAKDANIRQSLIDRWGGKEKAIGRKADPGPLYGVTADVWSALAIAVTWSETQAQEGAAA